MTDALAIPSIRTERLELVSMSLLCMRLLRGTQPFTSDSDRDPVVTTPDEQTHGIGRAVEPRTARAQASASLVG